jgi:hypothetical protein
MHLCVQAQGKGPMYVASCRGHAACISALADHGADVNASLVSESVCVEGSEALVQHDFDATFEYPLSPFPFPALYRLEASRPWPLHAPPVTLPLSRLF